MRQVVELKKRGSSRVPGGWGQFGENSERIINTIRIPGKHGLEVAGRRCIP